MLITGIPQEGSIVVINEGIPGALFSVLTLKKVNAQCSCQCRNQASLLECQLHVGGEERGGGGKVSGSVGGVERLDGVEMEGGSSVWGGGGTSEEEGEGEET